MISSCVGNATGFGIIEISKMATTYENVHQSVFRCYHILELTKRLLVEGTPSSIVMEIIREIEAQPDLPYQLSE